MTILADLLVIGGGVLIGRWIARRLRGKDGGGEPGREPDAASEVPKKEGRAVTGDPLAGFPCKLGDVVVRVAERDEAWLAGALLLEEERPVGAVFVAPEAGGDRALFVRDAPGAGLTWLAPLAKGEIALTKDPPHSIEHAGLRYERARRLPVRVSRLGSGAPAIGDRAVVAEYAGPGAERILVVAGAEDTLAWKGVALGEGEYDVLPAGKSTLDP